VETRSIIKREKKTVSSPIKMLTLPGKMAHDIQANQKKIGPAIFGRLLMHIY
jgi:hypothetical protein